MRARTPPSGQAYEDFMDERIFHPLGMRDTTFWPSEEQLARTTKCYAANTEKTGLVEQRISQLAYPLNDHYRKPMPAGGLFATAADCARFLQMILSGGEVGGRRYISEASIAEMTRKQTDDSIPNNYGLAWGTEEGKAGVYGHGGACKTNMKVDPKLGLITVFLIQHNGDWPNEEAGTVGAAFTAAAEKLVG
jgi:CubicO group peptidase (beta-lactamase class C family)